MPIVKEIGSEEGDLKVTYKLSPDEVMKSLGGGTLDHYKADASEIPIIKKSAEALHHLSGSGYIYGYKEFNLVLEFLEKYNGALGIEILMYVERKGGSRGRAQTVLKVLSNDGLIQKTEKKTLTDEEVLEVLKRSSRESPL